MARLEKGDRVLVEAIYVGKPQTGLDPVVRATCQSSGDADSKRAMHANGEKSIHPHPGVPVEDLLEELELAAPRADGEWPRVSEDDNDRYWKLRRAREAAQRPKFEPGQEVEAPDGRYVVIGITDDGMVECREESRFFFPQDLTPTTEKGD